MRHKSRPEPVRFVQAPIERCHVPGRVGAAHPGVSAVGWNAPSRQLRWLSHFRSRSRELETAAPAGDSIPSVPVPPGVQVKYGRRPI